MSAGGRAPRRWAEHGRFVLSNPAGAGPRYLFDRLVPAHGRRARWSRAAARRSPTLARWALSPAGAAASAAGSLLETALQPLGSAPWGEWIVVRPHADDRRGRLTAFLFAPEARVPDRFVKLRRAGGAGGSLAEEAAVLAGLQEQLPDPLAATIPRVVEPARAGAEHGGVEVLVLSSLPGRSGYVDLLGAFSPARHAARHLRAAGGWLARFHRATLRRDPPWSLPAWEELAPSAGDARPEWHRRLAGELAEAPWPQVAGHGDFWLRNLLVAGGESEELLPAVVDWEHHRPAAAPFSDLFHFACTYAFTYPWRGRRRAPEEAFARAFLRDTVLSREVRRYLRAYTRETGMDAGVLGELFRVFLLCRARGGAGLARTSGSGAVGRRPWAALYRSVEGAERSVFSG